MEFKQIEEILLREEGIAEFNRSLTNLKENGISGKATTKGITINYNGKKYTIPTDCSNIPPELKKFEKDIITAFKGKTHGAIDRVSNSAGNYYKTPEPYKVGHRAQFLLKK